jgi:ferritin-like metal-binding protein YciE
MANGTLRELWEHELQDLYSAEQKIVATLPELIGAASSPDLSGALRQHLERTKIHLDRLNLIFKQAGISATAASSGLDTVVRAGSDQIKRYSGELRDAAIIAAAQHVEHYEMAGYGCARTWARQLNDDWAADLLQQTLDEEGDADARLTDLAQSGINEGAAAGDRRDTTFRRLRYVDVDDLGNAEQYRDVKIRNRSGDELGKADGFVVDSSGRPYYLVVDSGGLFVGRRYVVPVGRVRFSHGEFTVDLDKELAKRYPEFNRDAFLSMTDEEARRYEWRVLEAIDPEAARSSTRALDYERYPYYREPDWYDRNVAARSAATFADSTRSSASRPVPIVESSGERVVAREVPESRPEPPKREQTRGRGSDER